MWIAALCSSVVAAISTRLARREGPHRPLRYGGTTKLRTQSAPQLERSPTYFHSVVGCADLQRLSGARDLLESPRFREQAVDRRVIMHRFVMEQAKMPCPSHLAELDADDVA